MKSPKHGPPTSSTDDDSEPIAPWRAVVEPEALLQLLRAVLGWPIRAPLPDEAAATMGRPLPDVLTIDPGLWLAWCTAGLQLAAHLDLDGKPDDEGHSKLKEASDAAKRVVTALAMLRAGGNITYAATSLGTSRVGLRKVLRREGMHPWPQQPKPTTEQRLAISGLKLHPLVLAPLAERISDVETLAETLDRVRLSLANRA